MKVTASQACVPVDAVHIRTQSAMSLPVCCAKCSSSLPMPQPTTNTCPFEVKVPPFADGHTGGVVAGVGAVKDGMVGDKLAGAGVPAPAIAGLVRATGLEGLEVPGTAPSNTEDAGAGLFSGIPPELDCKRVTLLEPAMLVLEDTIGYKEVEEEVTPAGMIVLGFSVPEDKI